MASWRVGDEGLRRLGRQVKVVQAHRRRLWLYRTLRMTSQTQGEIHGLIRGWGGRQVCSALLNP